MRLGKELYIGLAVNVQPAISPDAPLCRRCGAYILKRTGSFGRYGAMVSFHAAGPRRKMQNRVGQRVTVARLPSAACSLPGAGDR